MSQQNNKKPLDELISRAVSRENLKFDFSKWKVQNQQEIQDFQAQIKHSGINNPVLTNIWRMIMNSRVTKLAAVAVIVIAVLVVVSQFGDSVDVSSVALARVAKNMEEIHSYTCRMTSWQRPVEGSDDAEASQAEEVSMQFWWSDQYGFKMEQYTDGELSLIVCMLNETNEGIRVLPKEKKYIRGQLTDEESAIMKKQEMDPREWVNLFLAADCKLLGQDVIDGDTVDGVEVNRPGAIRKSSEQLKDFVARIWIDIESELPSRLEEKYTYGSIRSGVVADQFQWNVEINTHDLESDVHEDYTRL